MELNWTELIWLGTGPSGGNFSLW